MHKTDSNYSMKCESVIVILFVNWYTVGSLCCVRDEKKEKEEG